MKTINTCLTNLSRVLLLAATGIALAEGAAQAQIIYDPFDDAASFSSTALAGTTPNTDVPGGTWAVQGGGVTLQVAANGYTGITSLYGTGGTQVEHAFINGDSATISTAGSNSGSLTLSAYIANFSTNDASLGFSPAAAPTGDGYQLYGLNLYDNGSLQLTLNGTTSTAIAYAGGTFDSSGATAYQVSLTINTATGAVTGVSLSGSTADYSSFLGGTSFTPADTAYATMNTGFAASYADFSLTAAAAPEPTTWALMLGGFCVLAGLQRFRFRRL